MAKYADLNTTQKGLYNELKDAKSKNVDIGIVIANFEQNDFVPVLTAIDDQGYTPLGSFESLTLDQLQPVLCSFKSHVFLDEVVNEKIFSSKKGDEVKSISLIECVTDPNCNQLEVLYKIKKTIGLSQFWKVISKDDRDNIKSALEKERNSDRNGGYVEMLELINNIEEDMEVGNKSSSRTSKAIVAGAICGVIAGLAVGGGLFAAGAQLPILTLIGIAVAAALVTGLVAGGITYEMSKPSEVPSNNLNKVDVETQQVTMDAKMYQFS